MRRMMKRKRNRKRKKKKDVEGETVREERKEETEK